MTAYELQHKNVVPVGLGATSHNDGANWIKRYASQIEKITSKLERGLEITIHIRYNEGSARYDWAIEGEDYFTYRIGLKDLEETKSWLKNEKLQNPFITFVVDTK